MNGGIVAKNIIENKKEITSSNSAILFSGGVDSLATFIRRQESQPYLITMWGADIKIDNEIGWEVVKNYNCEFARKHSLENIFIKSNYRKFMNEDALTKKYGKYVNSWWLGVKHGLALIGSCAPVCFILNIDKIYIPGTPSLNNYIHKLRFSSSRVIHEGYELNRQEKIQIITEYIKTQDNNLSIRACYMSANGDNCGICEKCYRTITGLLVEGIDPRNHGFSSFDIEDIKKKFILGVWKIDKNTLSMWKEMQTRLMTNGINNNSLYKDYLLWLLNSDFDKFYKASRFRNMLRTIKYKLLTKKTD
jgi:7-cyano-7-deazaguanine synthase in queuosine biosynthesis